MKRQGKIVVEAIKNSSPQVPVQIVGAQNPAFANKIIGTKIVNDRHTINEMMKTIEKVYGHMATPKVTNYIYENYQKLKSVYEKRLEFNHQQAIIPIGMTEDRLFVDFFMSHVTSGKKYNTLTHQNIINLKTAENRAKDNCPMTKCNVFIKYRLPFSIYDNLQTTYIPKPAELEIVEILINNGIFIDSEKMYTLCDKQPIFIDYLEYLHQKSQVTCLDIMLPGYYYIFDFSKYDKEELLFLYENMVLLNEHLSKNTSLSQIRKKFYAKEMEILQKIYEKVKEPDFLLPANDYDLPFLVNSPPISQVTNNIIQAKKAITNNKLDPLLQLKEAGLPVYNPKINFPGEFRGIEHSSHLRKDYISKPVKQITYPDSEA